MKKVLVVLYLTFTTSCLLIPSYSAVSGLTHKLDLINESWYFQLCFTILMIYVIQELINNFSKPLFNFKFISSTLLASLLSPLSYTILYPIKLVLAIMIFIYCIIEKETKKRKQKAFKKMGKL